MPVCLKCMSLDRKKKPECLEETLEARGKPANSILTDLGIEPPNPWDVRRKVSIYIAVWDPALPIMFKSEELTLSTLLLNHCICINENIIILSLGTLQGKSVYNIACTLSCKIASSFLNKECNTIYGPNDFHKMVAQNIMDRHLYFIVDIRHCGLKGSNGFFKHTVNPSMVDSSDSSDYFLSLQCLCLSVHWPLI